MSDLRQLGFYPLLRLGLQRLRETKDYNISSHERLNEAFALGVFAGKAAVAKKRAKEMYSPDVIPDVARRSFPLSRVRTDPETGTLLVPLSFNIAEPILLQVAPAELHIFLDGSGDALKQMLAAVQRMNGALSYTQFVGLEIVGVNDPRPCSAIIAAHGRDAEETLHRFGRQIDQELDPIRHGYSIDFLYPGTRPFQASHAFASGAFQARREAIFKAVFGYLDSQKVIFVSALLQDFDSMMRDTAPKLAVEYKN